MSMEYQQLRDIVRTATVADIEFSEHEVSSHAELNEQRRGFTAESVCGFRMPPGVKVSYIRAQGGKRGLHWYVVSWHDYPNGVGDSFACSSEQAARDAVLLELKRILEKDA